MHFDITREFLHVLQAEDLLLQRAPCVYELYRPTTVRDCECGRSNLDQLRRLRCVIRPRQGFDEVDPSVLLGFAVLGPEDEMLLGQQFHFAQWHYHEVALLVLIVYGLAAEEDEVYADECHEVDGDAGLYDVLQS